MGGVFGEEIHVKRVESLIDGVDGVLHAASLVVGHADGWVYAGQGPCSNGGQDADETVQGTSSGRCSFYDDSVIG